jgi:aspartyl protease family protein
MPLETPAPPPPPGRKVTASPWFWLAILVALTALLVAFLENQFPGAVSDPGKGASILNNLLWMALLAPALILRWRSRPRTSLRHLAIWLLIFAGLTAVLTFKDDAQRIGKRILGGAAPAAGVEMEDGAIRFTRDVDGHFTIRAEVNGQRVMFLLDTGATDIVLSPQDAERIGIAPAQLTFNRMVQTANGMGWAASVELTSVVVGPIAIGPMRASVNKASMDRSLLGMEFLNRLSRWRVEGDQLYLQR